MQKILVVVDMQNDFITGCLGNAECVKVVDEVVKLIGAGDYAKVYVTKDTHKENYLQTREGKKLPVVHCVEKTQGWELQKDVADALAATFSKEQVVEVCKPSFGSVSLGQLLKQDESASADGLQIDFCGVCTGICVISNALLAKAFVPEAQIRVREKACACVTPQTHATAIAAMETCQIDIMRERATE